MEQKKGPCTRFGAARGTLQDYHQRGFRNAFAAHGDLLTDDEIAQMESMWHYRRTPSVDDLPLIERLEKVAAAIVKQWQH